MNKKILLGLILGMVLVFGGIFAAVYFTSQPKKSSNTTNQTSSNTTNSSYSLKIDSSLPLPANTAGDFKFSIAKSDGSIQKDFVIKDQKIAYVYFLRTDINKLVVMNPELDSGSGQFTIKNFNPGEDANYRMFVSFEALDMQNGFFEQHNIMVKQDISVGNKALYKVEAFGDVRASSSVAGINVNIDGWRTGHGLTRTLSLSFDKDGTPFKDTSSFNGSPARIYAFKQGSMDMAFVNTEQITRDPDTGNIKFNILFPKEGIYKLFVELKIGDQIQQTTFVLDLKDLE